ncbi:thiol-activated cytolysin family protein [Chitinophaga sp. OAE865]|uniref:thiol-activated cytolysin family protein n=1 Tax=Chitinophaga sp. OAE865 TaxID=2817898 RepID=UPI003391B6FB
MYTPFQPDWDYTPLPVVVSVPFPTKNVSDTLLPSTATTQEFINSALEQSDMLGKQFQSFSYEMSQITNYSQLKLSFGINFNLGTFLTVGAKFDKEKVKKTTALTAKFLQENFTLTMNLPRKGQLIDKVADQSIFKYSPVYINSVTYGRLGIMLAESNYSYDSLSVAFKAAIKFGKDKANGISANIDVNKVKMIDEAEIKIFIAGGDGTYAVKAIDGFQGFVDFIKLGGAFARDNYGIPISFTARYLSDLSPYKSIFKIDMNN